MTRSKADLRADIPIQYLRRLLRYLPERGELFWAFTAVNQDGRYVGGIRNYTYKKARVCFAHFHGWWPTGMVDHIDGDNTNDSIRNLREATHAQNNANRGSLAGSRSRYVGVAYDQRSGKWKGQVYKDGKNNNTPRRRCETAAALDRDRLALALHGDFARLNIDA